MNHIHAKDQGQRSVASQDRLETDGQMELIALPSVLTRMVARDSAITEGPHTLKSVEISSTAAQLYKELQKEWNWQMSWTVVTMHQFCIISKTLSFLEVLVVIQYSVSAVRSGYTRSVVV